MRRSVLVYPTTVGLPVVPEEAWMRATCVHRNSEHPERVGLAQVVLGRERQQRDVVEGADVVGLHARLVELARVQGNVLVGVPHGPAEPLELQRPQFVARQPLLRVEFVACRRVEPLAAHRCLLVVWLRPRNSATTSPVSSVTLTS